MERKGDGYREMRVVYWRTPLDYEEVRRKRGEVYIFENLCKGCGYCIEFCPNGVLEKSPKLNSKGYHPPYVKNPDECTGCQFCQRICPDFAIVVSKLETEVIS